MCRKLILQIIATSVSTIRTLNRQDRLIMMNKYNHSKMKVYPKVEWLLRVTDAPLSSRLAILIVGGPQSM
jgi:hypothetical protein